LFLRSFLWENIGLLDDEDLQATKNLPRDDCQSSDEGPVEENSTSEDESSIEKETVAGEDDEYGEPDDNPYHPYWERHILFPLVEYDSEAKSGNGESAEDNDGVESPVDDGKRWHRANPVSWNPAKLLNGVLLPHRNTRTRSINHYIGYLVSYTYRKVAPSSTFQRLYQPEVSRIRRQSCADSKGETSLDPS
jgi:hypothetical protein